MVRVRVPGLAASVLLLAAACGPAPSSFGRAPGSNEPRDPSATGPGEGDAPEASAASRAPGEASGPYKHFAINHVLSTGQSNAIAIDATPPLTAVQPYANLKFDSGVMPGRQCDGEGCKAYATPMRFVPLIEGDSFFGYGVETMSSGFANEASKLAKDRYLAGTSTPTHDVLVSLHGRRGDTYGCLRKGGCSRHVAGYIAPFAEGMMEVRDAMAIARAAGKTYVVRAVTTLHGEADHDAYASGTQDVPMPATSGQGILASHGDAMLEWQNDYEAGVKAITGQSLPVPLFMLQMSNWKDAPQSRIPTSQLDAHVTAPGKVVVVTPGYPIGYAGDCLHFTNHQERRIGEYFGKAYAQAVIGGKPWEPLRPLLVTRRGNVITAKFLVPRPPLVIDTERVKDPGHYGFELVDGSTAPPAITGVALVSPDTVEITLASPPTGTDTRLRYAFTATPNACPGSEAGPRGNLRDSDDTPSNHGYELFNWSVHFDERVH